ncbi:MAG TPA: adenine phosphoribosyltransferase [Thermoanaerobaculia bacterium]|nr:adenine phosphoribosyltransferase [Thermoanaerobaculia bacterium]
MDLRAFIRDVPDFPRPGITFKDITPLLRDPAAFSMSVERLAAPFRDAGITRIAAIESRGFLFGGAMARLLGCGLVPVRKPAKLPWTTYRHEYELEYGTDALEIHDDALETADRVLIVDDVLATGGTLSAARALVALFGAELAGAALLIELAFLGARKRLDGLELHSLIRYD